jgi:hypothetical protein
MEDWKVFRPAIWLGMLGIALLLVVKPVFFGAAVLGAAIGIAIRIEQGRRRRAREAQDAPPPRRRRR